MPIATLKFKLPDEQLEFDRCMLASDMQAVIFDFFEKIRHILKYESEERSQEFLNGIYYIQKIMLEILEEKELSLEI